MLGCGKEKITLVFFSLVIIINLFEEITFFKDINVGAYYPLLLALLNAPSILVDILPFIFLISTQFIFIKFFERNELSIFKHSGLTNTKILSILVSFSFILGIVIIFGFYTFSSKLKK